MFIMQRCSGGVTKADAAGLKCGHPKHGLRLFAHSCSAGRLETTMASREAATLAATVGQHLAFGEVNVSADSDTIRRVIEAIFWNLTEAGLVASSTQMQREPLMALLLEACKDWIARGYCIGQVFGRLYMSYLEAYADIVPKASSMRPHQDKAKYAKRLGVRFSSNDGQPTSIIFSAGNGVHSDKVSVPLRSSCYYVADEAIMKKGHPLNIFHSVLKCEIYRGHG